MVAYMLEQGTFYAHSMVTKMGILSMTKEDKSFHLSAAAILIKDRKKF
jgi:hypothetical protein